MYTYSYIVLYQRFGKTVCMRVCLLLPEIQVSKPPRRPRGEMADPASREFIVIYSSFFTKEREEKKPEWVQGEEGKRKKEKMNDKRFYRISAIAELYP